MSEEFHSDEEISCGDEESDSDFNFDDEIRVIRSNAIVEIET